MSSLVINQTLSRLHYPPTAKGHWLLGTMRDFQRDVLGTSVRLFKEFGPAVRIHFAMGLYGFFFVHPDHNKHILQDNNKNYTKQPHPTNLLLKPVAGNGLLTNDGEVWRRQRRLIQPAFHRQQIAGFAETMGQHALKMLDRWQAYIESGRPFDLEVEMMRLTLGIAGATLFSMDLTGEAQRVGHAFHDVSTIFSRLNLSPTSLYTVRLPFWPSTRRLNEGVAKLDEVVYRIIDERRRAQEDKGDLLSLLMSVRDEESGEVMNDRQLRDEVITLMIAGHETTSVALTWAFYLLSQHRHVQEKLEAELDEVLSGRVPTLADIPNLTYTRMVIDETLRLYPPAFGMARWGNDQDKIGDYDVPRNASITMMPFLTHRMAEFWPDPERFDPERFTPDKVMERPRYAYLPFGGGPRQCIGNTFALTEATLILATIAQRYRLDLLPGREVEIEPLITLRVKDGLPMQLSNRK